MTLRRGLGFCFCHGIQDRPQYDDTRKECRQRRVKVINQSHVVDDLVKDIEAQADGYTDDYSAADADSPVYANHKWGGYQNHDKGCQGIDGPSPKGRLVAV